MRLIRSADSHRIGEIRNEVPGGWSITTSNASGQIATVAANQTTTGVNFVIRADPTSFSISGNVYNDLDGDGIHDPNESGIAGRRVFVDVDGDGVFDTNEVSALTAADGTYTIPNVSRGIYNVTLDSLTFWDATGRGVGHSAG